jgi:iron complex transport system ATP-binding protein
MNNGLEKILSFNSLLIGYKSGRGKNVLLPPLNGFARKGDLIAVIGENGIGKSTLLRTIAGLQESLGGEILIGDTRIKDYPRYSLAKNIGYISTEPVRVSNMKVYDLVSLGRYPHTNWLGKLEDNDHAIVADAIEKVGLQPLVGRYINEISDGERQRAMIARVLAQDTNILVMDEPTAFLDIRSKYEIVHLLHDLSKTRGKTIIFSTHDLLTAISDSDKIWLTLKDSFIDGAPEDLIINGVFEKLFGESTVKFNQSDGTFNLKRILRGKIFVEGTGIDKYWTEKAANRAGLGISTDPSGLKVTISGKGEEIKWKITEGSDIIEFRSVYELVNWLNER